MCNRPTFLVPFLFPLIVCLGGCYPTDTRPSGAATNPATVADATPDDGTFEWVDEDEAEVVLAMEYSLPEVSKSDLWRFGLRRIKPKPKELEGTHIGHGMSYGFAACGNSGGCNGSIGLTGDLPSDGKVTVYASISWNFTDKNKGKFTKELRVPWMGEITEDVGSGASVHCYFEKQKPTVKP